MHVSQHIMYQLIPFYARAVMDMELHFGRQYDLFRFKIQAFWDVTLCHRDTVSL